MFQFYTTFILILYFTCSISIHPSKSSSKFIHKSNSNHHVVAIITETDQFIENNNNTNNNNDSFSKPPDKQVLNEHLKIIITISCISVGIMILIVVIYVTKKYFNHRTINVSETNEHTVPLTRLKQNSYL
ncbi:unnamed protein product [Rotaria sp. Silwood1]|nr:unnamed protein product [Rotaria sp. Silwood1]